MAYCSYGDVQADFKYIIFDPSAGATTLITQEQVTKFIAEADAYINSQVGTRFVTPITGDTDSLALMSLFSRTLVSNRIRGILSVKQTTNADANQNVKSEGMSTKDVISALADIKAGNTQLTGATLLLAGAGFYSNNQANGESPCFQKHRKQW